MMMYWDRSLTLTQIGLLAVGLEPAKNKEELVARLAEVPEIGVTRGTLFAERIQLFYQVDDLTTKGLMKKNQDGTVETTELGFMSLEKHHQASKEIRDFVAKAGHTL
jgi:hypothetical protein